MLFRLALALANVEGLACTCQRVGLVGKCEGEGAEVEEVPTEGFLVLEVG
jgi:hypothetical protein